MLMKTSDHTIAQTASLRYYAIPGIDIPADVAFQYREPAEDNAWIERF